MVSGVCLAKTSSHDHTFLFKHIQVEPLHRLDMVGADHRGTRAGAFFRPQLGRLPNLKDKCRGLRLKPRINHTPVLPKPQQLSKGLFRCHRQASSATRQAPLTTGNSEEPPLCPFDLKNLMLYRRKKGII